MTLDVDAVIHEAADAAIAPQSAAASAPAALKTPDLGDVIVNIRFFPDGTVNTIDNRPAQISAQDWFHLLCRKAPFSFCSLAGGRGHYRIPFANFQAIVAEAAK